jgi:hypothetical protein
VTTDFVRRLHSAIAAMAASRSARTAELQELQVDPNSFVQDGTVRLHSLSTWWQDARLLGNKDLLKLSCSARILGPTRIFVFPRNRIRRLSRYSSLFQTGLRIEHSESSFPEFVLFFPSRVALPSRFEKLKSKLVHLGYEVYD